MFLILVSLVAGMIAGISPCVLPVLPVVLVAGATGTASSSWRRSLSIVLGLITSFSVLILAGAQIISVFHLPQAFLQDLGIALLILIGLGFLVPQLGVVLERPFARLVARQPRLSRSGFVIGLALGLVFVPCAGPVLATIDVLGANEHVNFMTAVVTLAFSIGASVPLIVVALAGGAIVARARAIRERGLVLRRVGGAVLIVMAVVIATNVLNSLQTDVPGYTNALQQRVEGSSAVHKELHALQPNADGQLADCLQNSPVLEECGVAPNFANVTAWLNTPDGKPLSINEMRGKVVLIDFWTYSCINCERALPHVEAWYNRYKSDGLVVVGVHTPEFSFEHVVSNVRSATKSLHVDFPVDVDDGDATWNAYGNDSWPADYLIDANGVVRHVGIGEGDYSLTERFIRRLLLAAHPGLKLPPPTNLPDLTPTQFTNPETYLGYQRAAYADNAGLAPNVAMSYTFPSALPSNYFSFSGVWDQHEEEATAGEHAELELSFVDQDVYLVMGGSGSVRVSSGDGTAPTTLKVDGIPRLYTLLHATTTEAGTMVLHVSPGVEAYDFTFG
jgi:cytochrome c biogenesis protein CcdA/thiol-disulfide isomerase/thioredoxin